MTATPRPKLLATRSRVLVVDDEPMVRMVARLMMERAGFAVVEAGSAAEAMQLVQDAETPFEAILLDVTLPDRFGPDVLADLREVTPESGIVMTSGRSEEELPDHGADGFLPKPFTKEQLVAAVRAVVLVQ